MQLSECDGQLRLSTACFSRLARFIETELGIKMPDSKIAMVQSRLLRRVRELSFDSIEAYLEHFFGESNTDEERIYLIDAITTNKTEFFRERQHFDFMSETLLPSLPYSLSETFTVWSAACSSGQEPFTLAMVMSEHASRRPGFKFAILATDVSTRVLRQAKSGVYAESDIAPIPHQLRGKYILLSKDRSLQAVRMHPDLRKKISFHRLNLMEDCYPIKDLFDIVFLRNVLIYFNRETQEAVVGKVCRHIKPGGYLFVSHSESLAGLNLPLTPVQAAVFRKLE